jgi:hypothetical protein
VPSSIDTDRDPPRAVYHHALIVCRRVIGLFAVCSLQSLAACGGGSGGGPGGGGAGGGTATGSGHLRATIDGQAWAADQNTIQVNSSAAVPGTLTITGTRVTSAANYLSLTMALGYINGPATYPLGVNQGTNAGGTVTVLDQSSASQLGIWMTDLTGARGTLTVTSMSATRIAGTFQFMAPPQTGSAVTSTRTVTDGDFELPIPAAFAPTTADNYGSLIKATFNGGPWNGATVVGLGTPSSGVLSFGGTTTGVSLNLITVTAVQVGGTYDQTGVRLMASGTGASCCWGGNGDLSSVTITSLGATRAAGTFTATLPAAGGSAATGPLIITGGTFDVRFSPAN